jgi:uncharacterized membrane protein YraQ (UPF0718 family)
VKRDYRILLGIATVVVLVWLAPLGSPRFQFAVGSSLKLMQEYARLHLVTSLLPALFIAGAISVFLRGSAVLRYLGPDSPRASAYAVASVAGSILAVCSCTVLPVFAGIYAAGAGIGPASAFLYSGPAINVLAVVLSARVLGLGIGLARAVSAVLLSVLIGLGMSLLFREGAKQRPGRALPAEDAGGLALWKTGLLIAALVGVLVFSRSGCPCEAVLAQVSPLAMWGLSIASAVAEAVMLIAWLGVPWRKPVLAAIPVAALAILVPGDPRPAFLAGVAGFALILAGGKGQLRKWYDETLGLTVQIFPLLLAGVAATGFLLGTSDSQGLIPYSWIERAVGGDSLLTTLAASVVGAFMYFATLTEIPIVQGLMRSGMQPGTALALLLAGPALSLPSMLVIRGIIGTRKTVAYVSLVILVSTAAGLLFGAIAG